MTSKDCTDNVILFVPKGEEKCFPLFRFPHLSSAIARMGFNFNNKSLLEIPENILLHSRFLPIFNSVENFLKEYEGYHVFHYMDELGYPEDDIFDYLLTKIEYLSNYDYMRINRFLEFNLVDAFCSEHMDLIEYLKEIGEQPAADFDEFISILITEGIESMEIEDGVSGTV